MLTNVEWTTSGGKKCIAHKGMCQLGAPYSKRVVPDSLSPPLVCPTSSASGLFLVANSMTQVGDTTSGVSQAYLQSRLEGRKKEKALALGRGRWNRRGTVLTASEAIWGQDSLSASVDFCESLKGSITKACLDIQVASLISTSRATYLTPLSLSPLIYTRGKCPLPEGLQRVNEKAEGPSPGCPPERRPQLRAKGPAARPASGPGGSLDVTDTEAPEDGRPRHRAISVPGVWGRPATAFLIGFPVLLELLDGRSHVVKPVPISAFLL